MKDFDSKFKRAKSLDDMRHDISINLFRFNFIAKILPETGKRNMLVKYFEKIKNEVPRHIHNPQYWLQYAMAHISMNDYDKAQRYLQNAFDKARFRDYYDVDKINNQQARLNLKIASQHSVSILEAMKLFADTDQTLDRGNNDIYKFKIVMDYGNFIKSRNNNFNREQKNMILSACKVKLRSLSNIETSDINHFRQDALYSRCREVLKGLIEKLT